MTTTDTMSTTTEQPVRSGVLLGIMIGAAAGSLAALLLAPKSGKALRSGLKDKAQTLQSKGQEWLHTAKEAAGNAAQVYKEQSTRLIDKAHVVADRASEATHEAIGRTADAVAETEASAHRTIDKTADAAHHALDEAGRTLKSTS